MAEPTIAETVQRHRDQHDDYGQSVLGLHVLCRSARFDPETMRERSAGRYSVPRTMSVAYGDESGKRLTPDAVAQPRGDSYGLVAEMKKNFRPGDTKHWDQLSKYDRSLLGWWTTAESLDGHDLVLLTHLMSSVHAADALTQWEAAGGAFERPVAIVEFGHNEQGQTYFFLRRTVGKLSDPTHDEALRLGKQVPQRYVTDVLQTRKFYDAKPPLVYMLVVIWTNVLPPLAAEESYDPAEPGGPLVEVTAEQVREVLSRDFCPDRNDDRTPEVPRLSWVSEALDKLVEAGLATRSDDTYAVRLRQAGGKDAVEFLTRRLWKAPRRPAGPAADKQGELFALDSAEPEGE